MISRRELIVGAAVALGRRADSDASSPEPEASGERPSASQPATRVNFSVPRGACDCHTHVFGDPRAFPFAAGRTYTPELASVAELRALHRALHMDRVVVVQPSVYGSDNTCTMDAVRQLGDRARGVGVIDDATTDGTLDSMHRGGIRGIRLNLETFGQTDPDAARTRLREAIARISGRGWHVQVYTRLSIIEALGDDIRQSSVPIVVDHFGSADASMGIAQPGFQTLVGLVQSGRVYVKISGAYRCSVNGPDYADVAPFARALVSANPDRVVWGTDWPHPDSSRVAGRTATDMAPLLPIDDGRLLNQLAVWVPDAATRRRILVDNPRRLYAF
ncbi:MAG TPA: amidohydrolase family protein [Vicinamibacterales bacterium]|nr:amidohydrolase family protein [Vicinamibacterales bacterium]